MKTKLLFGTGLIAAACVLPKIDIVESRNTTVGGAGGALTLAGAGGSTDRGGGDAGALSAGSGGTDETVSSGAGEGGESSSGFHTLELLAGKPGGLGSADGIGADARLYNPALIALDYQGSLFIAGPPVGLRKLDSFSGTLSTTDLSLRVVGMTSAGSGALYLACADDVLREVSSAGVVSDIAGMANSVGSDDGVADAARFNFAADVVPERVGLALDPSGELFLTDTGNQTIRKVIVSTGAVTTLAGSPGLAGSADGTGTSARFSSPSAITFGFDGKLFVSDSDNKTIRSVDPGQGVVLTIAGAPGMAGATNGAGTEARFSLLGGLAADLDTLFVADGRTIRRIDFESADYSVTTFAGDASSSEILDGSLADARFGLVADLTFDQAGNLLIADSLGCAIRQIGPLQDKVQTLVGALATNGSNDGAAADARFNQPAGVVQDDEGNVFVADTRNEVIRELSSAGQVSTIAGSLGMSGDVDGTGSAASFWLEAFGAYPSAGLVFDGTGNLFVTDSQNQVVRQVDTGTGQVTTLVGSPRMPAGIALDNGALFVADEQNNQIGQLTFASGSWTVATLAGGSLGSNDGVGGEAQFALQCIGMAGMATDGQGTLFVSDCGNHTIRKIVAATRQVTTLAGTPGMSGSDDGVGAAARFNTPSGLAADGVGNLYVADFGNSTLRKIVIETGQVSTLVGVPGRRGILLGALPASLNSPTGVALLRDGGLVISDSGENSLLVVR